MIFRKFVINLYLTWVGFRFYLWWYYATYLFNEESNRWKWSKVRVRDVDQVNRIIEDVKKEKARTDKIFQDITFEIRAEQVLMFFNYKEIVDNVNDNQYYVKHNHDPEFIDIQALNALKTEFKKLDISFHERRDDFM